MGHSDEYIRKLKVTSREAYNAIGEVFCPCLNTMVVFNAQGFHHMEYDGGGRARTTKEITHKLALLPFAPRVLATSTEIELYKKDKIPKNRKQGACQKDVEYWAFVATVSVRGATKEKIRVIVRRVGSGKVLFWSVMKLRGKM